MLGTGKDKHYVHRLCGTKVHPNEIRVCFTNFWQGFDPHNNEILNLLKVASAKIGLSISVVNSSPDVEIQSCFANTPSEYLKYKAPVQILFLGENVRPNYTFFDYSISMDLGSYGGRNVYTPLWLLRSNLYAVDNKDYKPFSLKDLYQPKEIQRKHHSFNLKCCFIGNNMPPSRAQLFQDLRSIGFQVDIFGSQSNPVNDKIAKMSEYDFSLCTENSYHPGYVTEKLVDAYLSGTIPIYWGCIDPNIYNHNSFINLPEDLSTENLLSSAQKIIASSRRPLISVNSLRHIDDQTIDGIVKILTINFLNH